ncbi:hypothetical protein NJL98_004471 [Salmonella enterica]|nr:hypothetical protein [Salmonella enterica]EEK2864478.1 hypothetical protein [Salmonella enterica]EEK2973817.1 hypothetical protein [Salmonella enterica]EJJ7594798.1 hypothetical protein [Salmonella enterica]
MKTKYFALCVGFFATSHVMADSSQEQIKVMNYCNSLSVPLLTAATHYVSLKANDLPDDVAKKESTALVLDSEPYKLASSGIKSAMSQNLTEILNANNLAVHQKEMMNQGENYLGLHGYSWAVKKVGVFTAWCNYNHLQAEKK